MGMGTNHSSVTSSRNPSLHARLLGEKCFTQRNKHTLRGKMLENAEFLPNISLPRTNPSNVVMVGAYAKGLFTPATKVSFVADVNRF